MTTDNVTFSPPAISRSGTKCLLEFLRRADRAWKTDIMDISNMELDLLPLDIITLFPNITGQYCDSNQITQVPFEFHVMTQLVGHTTPSLPPLPLCPCLVSRRFCVSISTSCARPRWRYGSLGSSGRWNSCTSSRASKSTHASTYATGSYRPFRARSSTIS
jgi:hypothetical protein